MRDLLRLENQIPFFVLQTLFENTRVTRSCGDDQTLVKLILKFFNYVVGRPDGVLERIRNLEGKHLLDFFRLSFIPPKPGQKPREKAKWFIVKSKGKDEIPSLQWIPSAKKLSEGGIKFKSKNCDTFLEITFCKGVLEIPQIVMDDFTTWFLLNAVAFEQCYQHCSNHMTDYTSFMGCLIGNPTNAGFLGDQKIMENGFGTDKELERFFSNLGKDVSFDIGNNYLSTIFEDVNEYHRNGWHVQWARFKYTYFNTPWSFISALAAMILLLLLIVLMAFFAVYPYAGGKLPAAA